MSGIVECPHCLTRVLPMADRCCPKCGKDTRTPSTSPFTRLTVDAMTRFPALCCECAEPTTRVEAITGSSHDAEPLLLRLVLFVVAHVHLPGDEELMRIDVPRCKGCAKKSPLYPEHVSVEQRNATLKVMRIFADETRP